MLNFKTFDYNSNYYRLGSIIYYSIFKTYPNIAKLKKNLTQIKINYKDVENYSYDCLDFVNKLLNF